MTGRISYRTLKAAPDISAATTHEAAGKIGVLPSYLKPIASGMKICGRAFPIKGLLEFDICLHRGMAKADPGDVLIANVG
jgi:4-hydroxy-4-methyl-2-oxoglutarate aldolase